MRDVEDAEDVLLFSYGTLQDEPVQLACFGRRLAGKPDGINGYVRSSIEIPDPEAPDGSAAATYPIVDPTGNVTDEVRGRLFRVTSSELAAADAYEGPCYTRVHVPLRSGGRAWVYVRTGTATPRGTG